MKTAAIQTTEELGHDSIFKLLLKFSIPAAISNFMFTTYNVVDRIFISTALGTQSYASDGIPFYLFMICIAVGLMFGIGGGTLVSLRLGENDQPAAERILGNVIMIFLIGGVLTTALGFLFLKPLLYWFGADEATYPYAAAYMNVLLWFMAPDFLSLGVSNLIRAEGSPKFSMWNIAAGCLANIVLDYLFIFVLDWGIAGAAWATGISKLLSTLLMFWHFTLSPFRLLTLRLRNLRIDWPLVKAMAAIGLSPLILQSIISVIKAQINQSLRAHGGTQAVAAMTIVSTVIMLMMIPTFGVIMGYQPIVGFNYGDRQFRRVGATLKGAFLLSIASTSVLYLPEMIFTAPLVALFSKDDPAVVQLATHGLRLFVLLLPLWPIFGIGSNFFQATGRPRNTIWLTLFRNVFCFISLVLILPHFLGLNGSWLTAPIADASAGAVTLWLLYREFGKLRQLEIRERRETRSLRRREPPPSADYEPELGLPDLQL